MSRRTHVVRRAAVAALVPLALGSLAACGDDEDKDNDKAASDGTSVSSGTEASEQAGAGESGAALEEGQELEKQEFLDVYSAALDDATTAEFTLVVSAGGQDTKAEGEVDYSADPQAMSMEMEMPGAQAEIEMRMVDGAIYMTIPGVAQGKFIKVDLNDPNNPFGSMMTEQTDPRAQIETFSQGLSSATFDGSEDVDGEEMDRYTVVVDTQAMLDATEMDEQLREQALEQSPPSIEYQIWIDQEGQFRRMDYDMGKDLGAMSMQFDDWGTDLKITAPPADQVSKQTLADLMGAAGGGA